MSNNINDSKEKGVFIKEYILQENPIKINDTLFLHAMSIWLENMHYNGNKSTQKIEKNYQLIVQLHNDIDDSFTFNWNIEKTFTNSFRVCSKNCIMVNFDTIPNDTLNYNITTGQLTKQSKGKKIGELNLIAINNSK